MINITNIQQKSEEDLNIYEEEIALKLDEYLQKHGEFLMKSPIQSLFNIFNHQKRKMKDHNMAYEMIKRGFEITNDPNIFILLESLDAGELTRSNLEECISERATRFDHMPNIDFSYLKSIKDNQNKLEETINRQHKLIEEMNHKIESQSKLFVEFRALYEETIKNHNKEMSEIKQSIEDLKQTHNIELKEIEIKYEQSVEDLKQNVNRQSEYISDLQLKYDQRITDINDDLKEKSDDIMSIKENVLNANDQILKYSKEMENMNINNAELIKRVYNYFTCEVSQTGKGILNELKQREKNKFEPLFIPSQSSDDIYCIIDPNNDKGKFETNCGNFFIEFELENKINIIGIKLTSSNRWFPKSFNIEIDGILHKSVKNANELNGEYKEMEIRFKCIKGKKLRIIFTSNWNQNPKFIELKKIEIISSEEKYSKGVFWTFINECKTYDPHKSHIYISSTRFDFNSFFLLDAEYTICTGSENNPWFQIELTQGIAILTGFRLKRYFYSKMKEYKIIATENFDKPIENWILLFEINEKSENEHEDPFIYKFSTPSPPIRFVRLVQTGGNWKNELLLQFNHFEIFGTYF